MTGSDGFSAPGGFTLMELVVVTCLISLFLMFSIPRLQSLAPADRLNTSVRRLMDAVSELKYEAVRDGRFYTLHLDLDRSLLWTTHESMTKAESLAAKKAAYRLPPGIRILSVQMPDDAKVNRGDVQIVFSQRGYSSHAIIHLQDGEGRPVSLVIEPFMTATQYYDRNITFNGA